MENKMVKCDRCLRTRDLFQYTHFEADKFINQVKDNGNGENPRFTIETINLAQSRGLCEECAVEINKQHYDLTNPGESDKIYEKRNKK